MAHPVFLSSSKKQRTCGSKFELDTPSDHPRLENGHYAPLLSTQHLGKSMGALSTGMAHPLKIRFIKNAQPKGERNRGRHHYSEAKWRGKNFIFKARQNYDTALYLRYSKYSLYNYDSLVFGTVT